MEIELHIFTNCHTTAPSTEIINKSYDSFIETFGDIKSTVWCDPHPNTGIYNKYFQNLNKKFKIINKTESLSDGYIKAIKKSECDYLFMLEGDWIFKTDLIKHGICDLCYAMEHNGIYHLRFNKRTNRKAGGDCDLCKIKNVNYINNIPLFLCKTQFLSNNPHIINRKKYIDFIKKEYIKKNAGSKGIERNISGKPDTWGSVYGPMGYPSTVNHLDGRKKILI